MIYSLSVQHEIARGHGQVGKFRPNHIRGCLWRQHQRHQHCWSSGAKPLCSRVPILVPSTKTHPIAIFLNFSHLRGLISVQPNDWEPWKADVIKETFKPASNTWNFKEILHVCRGSSHFPLACSSLSRKRTRADLSWRPCILIPPTTTLLAAVFP